MTSGKQTIGIGLILALGFSGLLLGLDSCHKQHRFTSAEWQKLDAEKLAKFRACLPVSQPDGKVHLALVSIKNETNLTKVKIVAYAVGEVADFYAPQYSMSRGRWLINESARSYLRDEQCHEYKLQGRASNVGQIPDSGLIKLKSGEAYELTLEFPGLPENVRTGGLVYGDWVMPFYLR